MRCACLAALVLLLSACNMLTLNSGTANAPNSIFSSSAAPILTTATAGMLQAAKYFAIQLQNVGQNGTVDIPNISAISTSRYDVVAIDEITTSNSALKLNTVAIVNQIHATAGTALSHKILLAYVDIGEAENYRTYWQTAWTSSPPSFILGLDPNGFANNFTVDYADARWQSIVYGTPTSLVDQAMADGFDGVFLDNVAAYSYPAVVNADQSAQSDMVAFVSKISLYAKNKNPNFLIVTNGGAGLVNDPRFLAAIDADSEEGLFYGSSATQQGDIPTDGATRAATITLLERIQAMNKPVISIDYATKPDDVQLAYAGGAANRFIEYVTTRNLSQLTTTPPPALGQTSALRSVSAP